MKNEDWLKYRLENLANYSKTGLTAIELNLESINDFQFFKNAHELCTTEDPSTYCTKKL